jgi:hypothetical protein
MFPECSQVYNNLKSQGQVSLPLTSSFPPVDLLIRLLADKAQGVREGAKEICGHLLEGILCAKDGQKAKVLLLLLLRAYSQTTERFKTCKSFNRTNSHVGMPICPQID